MSRMRSARPLAVVHSARLIRDTAPPGFVVVVSGQSSAVDNRLAVATIVVHHVAIRRVRIMTENVILMWYYYHDPFSSVSSYLGQKNGLIDDEEVIEIP